MTISVLRYSVEGDNCTSYNDVSAPASGENLEITFLSGGDERKSDWSLLISPESFEKIVHFIMCARNEVAIKAFGKVLQEYQG